MKRNTTFIKPDAILGGDFHLRDSHPICRTDDFDVAQWKAVDFVSALQKKYDCPVLHSGDLFHHWKPSPSLLSKTIKHLPKNFRTVYGNHDLPQHNIELKDKCGIYTLHEARALTALETCHWNEFPTDKVHYHLEDKTILIWHILTYQIKKPFPGCTAPMARKLLMKYPKYDLILTGDNHKTFVAEYEGRLLVNPGSLTRQSAKQIDFKPSVFLYYASTNTVKQVFIPIMEGVISREHLESIEQRSERIDAFISTLSKDWQVGFDFNENLKRHQEANNTEKPIMDIIYKAIEA